MTSVPVVLFLCIHNSGRSAAARVLLDHYAQGRVRVQSAGSEPGAALNPAVVAVLAERGLNATKEYPKPVTDEMARSADVIVTMGCGDACPIFPGRRYLDWELDDPAGQPVPVVRAIVDDIDVRVQALLAELTGPLGETPEPARPDHQMTEAVRRRYAELAAGVAEGASCCTDEEKPSFGMTQYDERQVAELPGAATRASLGCGNPTAMVDLVAGDVVLDLGSGGGIDVILSARRVGPTGKAYGLDMTDEMLELARRNAAEAGVENVQFLRGQIEDIPLPSASVDVVISNCVINLSTDKAAVIDEAARVLRPGGRFAVSDVLADAGIDDATRRDMEQWTGCIVGALTAAEYLYLLEAAGLTDIEMQETHRVHAHAGSAIIRARKPA